MKAVLFVTIALVALVSAQYAGVAKMVGTTNDPTVSGLISFETSGNNILMHVNLKGITVNTNALHGIHLHQYGDISDPAGTAAGSHWNPLNQNHGCENTTIRHMGDTGNWMVNLDGTVNQTKTLDLISLTGTSSVIGFAVIFHSLVDDCNYTLSAGARLAQGVIGIANPAYHGLTSNMAAAVPAYTVTTAICNLANAAGTGISGWIRFDQPNLNSPTTVTAQINGLVAGSVHGFHIHQWGDLSLQDATSAGPHFTGPILNGFQAHSIPGSSFEKHVGDMGNLYYYDNLGFVYYNGSFSEFGLWGASNSIIGRAVIVHQLADDCTQPYGNAGARWAVCVIGAANPSYGGNATVPVGLEVPTPQNSTFCNYATTAASTAFVTSGMISTGVEAESSSPAAVLAPFIALFALIAFIMNN